MKYRTTSARSRAIARWSLAGGGLTAIGVGLTVIGMYRDNLATVAVALALLVVAYLAVWRTEKIERSPRPGRHRREGSR